MPFSAEPARQCAHGHTVRRVGCVSCVLVFDRSAAPAREAGIPPVPPSAIPEAGAQIDGVMALLGKQPRHYREGAEISHRQFDVACAYCREELRDLLAQREAVIAQYLSAEVIEAERISKTLGDDYVTRAGIWAQAARDLDLSLWAARRQLAQREAVIAQGQQENDRLKTLLRAAGLSDALPHGDLREVPDMKGFEQ